MKQRSARNAYLNGQLEILRLEESREQIGLYARQMTCTDNCRSAGQLSSQLELVSRLVALDHDQSERLKQMNIAAVQALTNVKAAQRRTKLADEHLRRVKKVAENRDEQKRSPHRLTTHRLRLVQARSVIT